MYTMKHRNHRRETGRTFLCAGVLLSHHDHTCLLPNGKEVAKHGKKISFFYKHGTFNSQQYSCSLKALSLQKTEHLSIYAHMREISKFFCIVHNQVCIFHYFLGPMSLAHIKTTKLQHAVSGKEMLSLWSLLAIYIHCICFCGQKNSSIVWVSSKRQCCLTDSSCCLGSFRRHIKSCRGKAVEVNN